MRRPFIGILLLLVVVLFGSVLAHIAFTDVAATSGLTVPNTFGGRQKKDYILETTGNGAAILDFDGDGANDIVVANGTALGGAPAGASSKPQLYRNDGAGHFHGVGRLALRNISRSWSENIPLNRSELITCSRCSSGIADRSRAAERTMRRRSGGSC